MFFRLWKLKKKKKVENAFMEVSMVSQSAVFTTCCWFISTHSRDSYNLSLNKKYNSKCKDITAIWNKFNCSIF